MRIVEALKLAVVAGIAVTLNVLTVRAQDGEFAHHPGEHNLTVSTADAIYAEVVRDYLKAHPTATVPPRAPLYGFTTGEEICTITGALNEDGSPKMTGCAIAITCGEWGACADWPKDFDIIFDESYNYDEGVGKSFVYHEFWHVVQFWNEGPISSAKYGKGHGQWNALNCRENEAYVYQKIWLQRHGHEQDVRKIMDLIIRHPCRPTTP